MEINKIMPLISVVIPAYNAEKTIKETINSVLSQTFSNFEVIVINDGSQDSTLEVISQISDLRIKVFSYSNAGVGKSRNRGISHANSPYIAFLDADDLWSSDKLEKQLAALESNPQASIAYSWTDCIDESGKFLRKGYHFTANGNVYELALVRNFIGSGSNPLILKVALEEVGGFDESLEAREDKELYTRLAARFKFVCVPQVQVFYRISEGSRSFNLNAYEKVTKEVIDKSFVNAPPNLQHLKKEALVNHYIFIASRASESQIAFSSFWIVLTSLFKILKYHPSALYQRRYLLSVIFLKSLISFWLPQSFISYLKQSLVRDKKLSKGLQVKQRKGLIES